MTIIAAVEQDDWFSSLPQELADSIKTIDLRAPKVVGNDSAKPKNSLNAERWAAFQSGQLSVGIFASSTF